MNTNSANNDLTPTADVLLIEHSKEYAELALRAIRDQTPESSVHVVHTSEEALYYLFRAGTYARRDSSMPRFVLMNVAVPGVGGQEVLERLRRDRVGCTVPVVVLSFSADPKLVEEFTSRGANSVVHAPLDPLGYSGTLRRVTAYWLNLNVSCAANHKL